MASPSSSKCQLSEWGLPPLIISWFRKKGITSLFDWQVECLCKDNVLYGDNLVYSAPTSAGKTLVADFLLLKKVLEHNKKALVIEPYVALTREKASSLKSMLYTTTARVGAFGGSYYTPGGMASVKVAVCTIEKANNFVNKLINESKLSDLGIIVVDEIHHLGDERRGYLLELLLTKILYYNSQEEKNKRIQIVGLSATIPNLQSIAAWLKASLFVTGYRPVPLIEKIKICDKIYDVSSYLENPSTCEPIESIDNEKIQLEKDFDDLFYICISSITSGHSILVFCESKRECEIMAANLANQIKICGNRLKSSNLSSVEISKQLRSNLTKEKISAVLDKLKKCPAGPDKELVKSLVFGVAFHHAGLTTEEREIIEDGFKNGAVKALMATSTLSSGVNLPARRVVIRSPTMVYSNGSGYQKVMLNPTTYKQMIGRAGRKNIDSSGESILICRPDNKDIALKLIKASLGNIESSLAAKMIASEGEASGLKKAVLEVIANSTAKTKVQLSQYLQSTFWLSSSPNKERDEFMASVIETLRYLVVKKFIEELKPGEYRSTRLGNAVLASGLHPDDSLELLQDLIKARQGFCLLNDLHIIYQVTPNDLARTVDLKDWQHYSKIWHELDEICQYVGERVGIDEITLARRCQGFTSTVGEEKERIYRRFWVALVINDLIKEIPLHRICDKYRMSKAVVQQAQRAVAQFAGVISIFCQELGYDNIAALVNPLESRINFSCQRDLLELIKLNLTRPIARALFNAGYKNPIALAKGDKLDIEFIIRQIKPFRKDASFTMESDSLPSMWVPELAKTMTTLDYASHIVETARGYLEIEYEIDLGHVQVSKRQSAISGSNSESGETSEMEHETKVLKRSRVETKADLGEDIATIRETGVATEQRNSDEMVKTRSSSPNFILNYIGQNESDLREFMEKWLSHSSICLNFRLNHKIDELIGVKIKRTKTSQRTTSGSKSSNSDRETSSNEGLELKHDLDPQKRIVTRLYASFDDDLTVYVIDKTRDLKLLKNELRNFLFNSYSSHDTTEQVSYFRPVKLYTQNLALTYTILYSAFGLDQFILHKYFEWHSFDIAWWLVNSCPTRGKGNCNCRLSLVRETKWASDYHHFLYPNLKRSSVANRSHSEFSKLKDQVKAGKTAILKPLITELITELGASNQLNAYSLVEVQSRLTLARITIHGIGIDMRNIRSELTLYEELLNQLQQVSQKHFAKSPISLSNMEHVARVIYQDLDLGKHLMNHRTISDITKRPTNSEVLNIIGKYHPFPKLVQDYRKLGKALEALRAVNYYARFDGHLNMTRVFGQCDFWQSTGRIAMHDPDLFTINRNFTVTIPAHGHRQAEDVDCAPRKCFIPKPGWVLVAADYSQLELRLLAHFSKDENLLHILNQDQDSDNTFDVFKTVACNVYAKTMEEVTNEDRQRVKQICYGVIYGMGNITLANRLGCDVKGAEDFRQSFHAAFPRIDNFTEELVAEARSKGYVESILGRRRSLESINSRNRSARMRDERRAVNSTIQSSASDLIKLAMQSVDKQILDNFVGEARLVLELHDELIYEVNPIISARFSKMLKQTMENLSMLDLKVKLLVNLNDGYDWSNLKTSIETVSDCCMDDSYDS